MEDLTPFEKRVLDNVKKKQVVALSETGDFFDFESFDKHEHPLIERTLNKLVTKGLINKGRSKGNYTIF